MLKDTHSIDQKKFLLLAKLETQFHGHTSLNTSMVKQLLEVFIKENCKNLVKKTLRIEKVLKIKGDKLYVKWKGYDNSFNSWINKSNLV